MAYMRDKNPFSTDEDDGYNLGDSSHGSSRAIRSTGHTGYSQEDEDFLKPKSRYEELQDQKYMSMDNQLNSTRRAMASIYESEGMGIATAEELVHQGEQLDNVERKTDKINEDMKTSQRHLTGIKSVFGSLKNWWSGDDKKKETPSEPPQRTSRLQATLETSSSETSSTGPHPAMRLRGDASGFYDDTDSGRTTQTQSYSTQKETLRSGFQAHDDELDENLGEMSLGMARLKNLALGLGDEIHTQNEQIDRINSKTERADVKIKDQNRQMGRILGK